MTETDQEAIYKVINKLEKYYERRRLSKFINLFSEQKFYNYIAFKEAVEGDFNLYKDIQRQPIEKDSRGTLSCAEPGDLSGRLGKAVSPFPEHSL